MVILIQEELRMFNYNPFKKKVNELFMVNNEIAFPHYLNNMEQFNLRVSMFIQWPRVSKTRKRWNGEDVTLLMIIGKILNANITIVQTPTAEGYGGAYKSIMANESDFCFVKFFQVDEFEDVEFTSPLELNSVELFVPYPKPIPTYLTIFMVFTLDQWAIIGLLLILAIAFFKSFSRYLKNTRRWKLGEVVMMMILIALNLSVKNLEKTAKLLRMVLYPFIILSLIFSVAFQSNLLTRLQFLFFYDGIKNLKDLALSGFPIYTYVHLPYPTAEVIRNQVISLPSLDYPELTQNGRKLAAFGLPFSRKRMPPRKPGVRPIRYYSLDQVLARGYGVYMFRKHSPFVSKFSRVMASIKQYALTNSRVIDKTVAIVDDYTMDDFQKEYLTLFELASVFYILILGLVLGLFVFFIEIFFKYHRNMKSGC
ncbi:uncharacterized protein LOC123316011 [Coccinella septempunctata]|uniref:uncharacterized protein LOC123316011 n=1 Tax=Coccinella septempunctata TaxID=41139 RepID=UPI001D07BA58|nr:uncharacterized protein LOC123316011 [Coccinella septempunctata]